MCYENIISIRGLCSTDTAKYYLDDYGISLFMAANTADEKFTSGKKLIETIINQGWQQTFTDLKIKGLDANKILNEATVGKVTETELTGVTGFKGQKYTLNKYCKLSRFYVYKIAVNFKTGGATSIKTNQSGVEKTIYTGTVAADDIVEVTVNEYMLDGFKILVDTTEATVYSGTNYIKNCTENMVQFTVESTDGTLKGQNFGIAAEVQVRCDTTNHLCKFADLIAREAAIYKISALFWNISNDSNRLNDYLIIKKEDAIAKMAWLDSSYNLLQYDPAAEKTYAPKGMYQKGLLKFGEVIPVPNCPCCLECRQDRYQMVLP